jgi:hypothetical protein
MQICRSSSLAISSGFLVSRCTSWKHHVPLYPGIFRFIALVLVFSCPALAQQEKEKPPPGYFRLVSWAGASDDLYYLRGKEKVAVSISPFAKSGHYPLPAGGALSFFRDIADAEGKLRTVPAGGTKINPAWKYPLLVISSAEAGAGPLAFSVYNEDPAEFRAGSVRVINATAHRVVASLSGREVAVPPGQLQTIDFEPESVEVVDVELWVENNGKRQPVYQRGWELEPDMRITAFVVKDSEGRYRVRRLREGKSTFLPKLETAAENRASPP